MSYKWSEEKVRRSMKNQKILHAVNSLRANKAVRTIFAPVMRAFRKLRILRYAKSEDSAYIKSLHNMYDGKRCFIIGNGPSLLPSDLDMLAENHEICFGANLIYKIFPQTKWRPTYYVVVDADCLLKSIDEIKKSGDFVKLFHFCAAKYGRTDMDNIRYLCMDYKIQKDYYARTAPERASEDVSHHISQFGTVTATSIELAIYMGFSKIYLLGCDHNYALKANKDGTVYHDQSVKTTYFSGIDASANDTSIQFVDFMTGSYLACKRTAEEKGVKIYNATRGGKLEVFERVDFNALFED